MQLFLLWWDEEHLKVRSGEHIGEHNCQETEVWTRLDQPKICLLRQCLTKYLEKKVNKFNKIGQN